MNLSLINLIFEQKCGRVDEQIVLLKQKLRMIFKGEAFNGKPTKTARSHGKKFQVSVKQETSKILGNLGWAYMQKSNFMAAEVVYKKAQMIDPDANKAYNLGLCLMKQARYKDAQLVLQEIVNRQFDRAEDVRAGIRARELLMELETWRQPPSGSPEELPDLDLDDDFVDGLERLMNKCGRVDEQIVLLKQKLRMIFKGEAFNGKPTKTARSHGKKFQVSVKQETSKILGNLGWAYMQKSNFMAAEVVYKKAQMIDPDANKAYNLGLCLMKQARYKDAQLVLQEIVNRQFDRAEDVRAGIRARELLMELETWRQPPSGSPEELPDLDLDDDFVDGLERLMNVWAPNKSKRLPIFEEMEKFRDQLQSAC
ncbi:Tetratricopeptide-like helical [Cynara cardunculus var. scolymus]|uniref:Tetratricopeptide-like helical n=1 Tax=Cynara cardunculus var. scolymus TaxID=59895 RepID=A0A103Y7B2_CYNCS|nr:Tetratricopeptide-like helical [Cynara cardunculus var. scolymus]